MKSKKLYNPFERVKEVENLVCKGDSRLYYDITCSGDYHGSVKACAVGCNLKCCFCWSVGRDHPIDPEFTQMLNNLKNRAPEFPDPSASYQYYSAREAVASMIKYAETKSYSDGFIGLYEKTFNSVPDNKNNITMLALTGGEATIGKDHLLGILKELKRIAKEEGTHYTLAIHTNGILPGEDETIIDAIKEYSEFASVRVSLKAATPALFSKFTGAEPYFFESPFRAVEGFVKKGINVWTAIVDHESMFPNDLRQSILDRLRDIDPKLVQTMEYEPLAMGGVTSRDEIFLTEFQRRR